MEIATRALGWLILVWFVGAFIVGGIMLALDERRLRRRKPRLEDVIAYTDDLVSQHGRDAFRINGEAMYEAQLAKDFDRYRFLKDVSGQLVDRFFSDNERQGTVDTAS